MTSSDRPMAAGSTSWATGNLLVWLPAALVLTLLATHLLFLLDVGWQVVSLPYELDYGEGPLAHQARLLGAGEPIYTALDTPPWRVANYPPVYPWLSAVLTPLTGAPLAAGRLISLVAALGSACAVGALAWLAGPRGPGRLRILGAVLAGMLFLAQPLVIKWACLARIDMLALCLALVGVAVFGLLRPGWMRAALCASLFLLAVFTRQSAVAGACAALIGAALYQRSELRRLLPLLLLGGVAGGAALLLGSGGAAWENLVVANANAFSAQRALQLLSELAREHPVPLLGAAGFLILLTRQVRTGHGGGADFGGALVAIYLGSALLIGLTVGKIGSNMNYLLELLAVSCAVTGALSARLATRVAPGDPRWSASWGAAAIALLLAATPPRTARMTLATEAYLSPREQVVRIMERVEGRIIAEETTLLLLAGKPLIFQPFEFTQLHAQGLWDEQPLVRAIEQEELALVVLNFQLEHPHAYALERFSPAVLAAIAEHYRLVGRFSLYHLYAPEHAIPSGAPAAL